MLKLIRSEIKTHFTDLHDKLYVHIWLCIYMFLTIIISPSSYSAQSDLMVCILNKFID